MNDNSPMHASADALEDFEEIGDEVRHFKLNDHLYTSQFNFPTNYIRTTKYSAISFIPVCLLMQFKRFANIYFLGIAII